jgi:hypothetical protein
LTCRVAGLASRDFGDRTTFSASWIETRSVTMAREFDLNIERVLENWTVAHALREVIAKALDEQH